MGDETLVAEERADEGFAVDRQLGCLADPFIGEHVLAAHVQVDTGGAGRSDDLRARGIGVLRDHRRGQIKGEVGLPGFDERGA